jgi:hypothetical protein
VVGSASDSRPANITQSYSGDTMPCDALVEAGKDVTLLIHEASMADEELEKAIEKGHSTIRQAIEMGTRQVSRSIEALNNVDHAYQNERQTPAFNPLFTEISQDTGGQVWTNVYRVGFRLHDR